MFPGWTTVSECEQEASSYVRVRKLISFIEFSVLIYFDYSPLLTLYRQPKKSG